LGAQLIVLDTEEKSAPTDEEHHVPINNTPPQHQPNIPPAQNTASAKPSTIRAGFIATSIARFGNSLSRTFRNNFYNQVDKSPMSVDSRLQREIEAKKKGQNLSM
jgi:hypothetical protein